MTQFPKILFPLILCGTFVRACFGAANRKRRWRAVYRHIFAYHSRATEADLPDRESLERKRLLWLFRGQRPPEFGRH